MKTSLLDGTWRLSGSLMVATVLLLFVWGSVAYAREGVGPGMVKQWRESAEQGDLEAQYNLGLMYANGEGVAENNAEAAKWFRKAAEQGDVTAQYELGVMYANAEGVVQDYVTTHMWWVQARAQGHEGATGNLDFLSPMMTKEQIAEAQKRAREWQETHPSSAATN